VSSLNVPGDDANLALAATVVKTALLSARDAADIGVPAVPLGDLRNLGLTEARAATVAALAKAVASGQINFLNAVSWEESVKELTELPGVGPWTATYIAMRVLGWPDAFPHQDLGLQKALSVKKASDALALSEKWRPWRAYAAMQLWNSLEEQHEISNHLR